jgi:NADH-quinone oxidoreductase subunit E
MMEKIRAQEVYGIINKHNKSKEQILSILLEIQEASGRNYVPEECAQIVAQELGLSLSKVYDVLTFYAMFSLKPRGKYILEICKSAPCHVNGSKNVRDMFEKELGISIGETTEDNMFTLQYSSCFGACDIAPAVKIGGKVYGNLNEQKVKEIVDLYRKEGQ